MITLATLPDAEAVRTLTRAAYAKWISLIGREPKPMTADYHQAVQDHQIHLLHEGETLVALIELIPADDHFLIENLAVHPGFQHRGLARRLLDHAEALARVAGHSEIRLYTNQRFAENIALYQRRGFTITSEEAVPTGVVTHMRKVLPI